jgi:hypothetical protein
MDELYSYLKTNWKIDLQFSIKTKNLFKKLKINEMA